LWYGSSGVKNSLSYFQNKKKNLKKILLKTQVEIPISYKKNTIITSYLIPSFWEMLLLKNCKTDTYKLILYSQHYVVQIPLTLYKSLIFFEYNTSQLFCITPFHTNYIGLYNILTQTLIYSVIKPVFTKLKFKGKGYYLYKNYRNTITPQFGYSHRLYLYSFFTHINFLNKTSLLCFGLHTSDLKQSSFFFKKLTSYKYIYGSWCTFLKANHL
jgi:hypothetical protein